jgi:hypothetical protein
MTLRLLPSVSSVYLHTDQEADVHHRRLAATLPLSLTHRSQLAQPARGRAGLPPYSSLPSGRGQNLPECASASIPSLLDRGPSDRLRLLQAAPAESKTRDMVRRGAFRMK